MMIAHFQKKTDRRKRNHLQAFSLQFLFLVSFSFLFFSCGGGGGGSPSSGSLSGEVISSLQDPVVADTTAPKVVSTIPVEGETFARKNAFTIFFSEPVDPSTVNVDSFWISNAGSFWISLGVRIPGSVLITPAVGDPRGAAAATFTPFQVLSSFTSYTVTATTGIKDLAGNPMPSNQSWTFQTGTIEDNISPTVLSLTPAADAVDVPINISIQIAFSEIMDSGSLLGSVFLMQADQRVEGTSSFVVNSGFGGTVATFLPRDLLRYDTTYSIHSTTAVRDSAGNTLANEATSFFKTVSAATSGGYTFLQPVKLAEGSVSFSLEIDHLGRLDAFLWDRAGLWLRRSTDGGTTFEEQKIIIPGAVLDQVSIENETIDTSSTLVIPRTTNGVSTLIEEVVYSRSIDGGDHFSAPLTVSSVDNVQSKRSSIARADQWVGIVWEEYIIPMQRAGFVGFDPAVMFSVSLDDGNTFSSPISLSGLQTIGHFPKIVISESRQINVVWSDQSGHMLLRRSVDAGATFSPAVQISSQTGSPQISIEADGTIDFLWYQGSPPRLFLSKSTDGGASLSPPLEFSFPADASFCILPRISPTGGMVASWSTGDPFFNNKKNFFAIARDGRTFSSPIPIPVLNGASLCPIGIIDTQSSSNLHFLWRIDSQGSFPGSTYYSKAVFSGP